MTASIRFRPRASPRVALSAALAVAATIAMPVRASGPVGEHFVHAFGAVSGSPQNPHYGSLAQGKNGAFYGMSQNGGLAGGYGEVFSVAPDGTYVFLLGLSALL
jgi:uncharacterized repeat protein (TIGR03803 family)